MINSGTTDSTFSIPLCPLTGGSRKKLTTNTKRDKAYQCLVCEGWERVISSKTLEFISYGAFFMRSMNSSLDAEMIILKFLLRTKKFTFKSIIVSTYYAILGRSYKRDGINKMRYSTPKTSQTAQDIPKDS